MKIAAVLLGTAGGLALLLAMAWMLRDRPSQDALIYGKLHDGLRVRREVVVPWPEHPSGELRMNFSHPHYRRPWDVPKEKPAAVPQRILVLGDSHTEGYCRRSEAFTALLDEQLSPSQVINNGISGWSPVDALRYYRDELATHEVDQVVYLFYAGNDLGEMFRPGSWQLRKRPEGGFEEFNTEAPSPPPAWKGQLFLLHLLPVNLLSDSERRVLTSHRMRLINPGCIDQQYLQQMFLRDSPEKLAEGKEMLQWIFSECKRLAEERNSTFTVALLPTRRMIEPEKMDDLAQRAHRILGLSPSTDATDLAVYEAAREAAGKAGVPVVDLKPALEKAHAANPELPLYWRLDFHLSTFGHPAVAEALLAGLGASSGR